MPFTNAENSVAIFCGVKPQIALSLDLFDEFHFQFQLDEETMNDQAHEAKGNSPKPVKIIHQTGSSHQIFHADGAWGMANQLGNIQLNFYVEHPPVVPHIIFPVTPDGKFTGESKVPEEDEDFFRVIREFQTSVTMSLAAAIQVNQVLSNFIEMAKKHSVSADVQNK